MKRILISVLFLFFAAVSFGQNSGGLQKGFKGVFEPAYQFGVGEFGLDRFKVNLTYGYQFNPYVSFGGGTGMRYYFNNSAAFVPLLADLKINFVDGKVSPYVSVVAGYNFDAFHSFGKVGYVVNPAAGVCIRRHEKGAVLLGVEFEVQQMLLPIDKFYENRYYTELKNSYSLSLNFGIIF